MAGIYIHIPFCKKACYYCNFHFSTNITYQVQMIDALCKEILVRKNELNIEEIETIYFGGGTPSLIDKEDLKRILYIISSIYKVTKNVEITIEVNPDDVNEEKLKAWKEIGINRISIGIQSFFEEDLIWMNRSHRAIQSELALSMILNNGYDNISADLIFGFQNLSNEKWEKNIQKLLDLNIPHISCYGMTVEDKTVFGNWQKTKKMNIINDEIASEQFLILINRLTTNGFSQYEISNFAKKGFESRHNSSYWKGKQYIGIGPSAHSYNGNTRRWNIANNALYIKYLNNNEVYYEDEILSNIDKINEYIMIQLRLQEGIDMAYLKSITTNEQYYQIANKIQSYLVQECIIKNNNNIALTLKGKLFADSIASDLFCE